MKDQINGDKALKLLERIAGALDIIATEKQTGSPTLTDATAYVWDAEQKQLKPVSNTGALNLNMLVGLSQHQRTLEQNTKQFAQGFAANNALLWGARGTGKSSLVKAIHKHINTETPLYLIEIYREDLSTLTTLLDFLRTENNKRFILFCDDLSFDEQETGYKSLKAILEGGVDGRPENVLFYATSNRRHLIPRNMIKNEPRGGAGRSPSGEIENPAIHKSEATEEKVSLSDRFGLWLGFYPCDQNDYLAMIDNYVEAYGITIDQADLHHQALEWEKTRGSRSGRVAWQFIQHLAGQHQKTL